MSVKKKPNGDKCLKCLNGNHFACVAWTCMCTFCVSTVDKQRAKALRLEEYWKNRNLSEGVLEFDANAIERKQESHGRVKPKSTWPKKEERSKNTFKPWDDFYDEFLV